MRRLYFVAAKLVAAWNRQASKIEPTYAPQHDDPDTRAIKQLHLETFADLALLCLTWKPNWRCRGLVEEVLAFLDEEGPFFDDVVFQHALKMTQTEASYALKLLRGFINDFLGIDPSRSIPVGVSIRDAFVRLRQLRLEVPS